MADEEFSAAEIFGERPKPRKSNAVKRIAEEKLEEEDFVFNRTESYSNDTVEETAVNEDALKSQATSAVKEAEVKKAKDKGTAHKASADKKADEPAVKVEKADDDAVSQHVEVVDDSASVDTADVTETVETADTAETTDTVDTVEAVDADDSSADKGGFTFERAEIKESASDIARKKAIEAFIASKGFIGKAFGFLYKTRKITFKISMIVAAALVFILFGVFLFQQYAMVKPSHDDYGYATLSYVYWEEDMWGQNFNMEQLIHYLTQHYNRWGGRILSFGQSILLLREGLDVAQGFHAVTLGAIFLLAFLFAQNGKKTKLLPVAALFTCALFGFIGKSVAISGFYWYCAAILYTVPNLYVFIGAWLLYVMLFDKRERMITPSKLMMLPFATIIFFFAGFSMEQVGIFAVVTAAAMLVCSCFKRRNPLVLLYGVPPLLSSITGCHIMLQAVGNTSRKNSHADFYNMPFKDQLLDSGDRIAKTLFSSDNILMVILVAVVTVLAAYYVYRKHKNIFTGALLALNVALGALSVAVSASNIVFGNVSVVMWLYLVVMAATVTIWLFSTKRKQDILIWALFFGSLASQAACLIAPIFPERCLMMFMLTMVLVASRAFNELLAVFEEIDRKKAVACVLSVTLAVSIIGVAGAGQIYEGFKENERVQDYNERMLQVTGKMYDEFGIEVESIQLMKLKNGTYAGSTQPYGRDLIKDWMKIYYRLPNGLEYADFIYDDYDEEALEIYEEQLEELENKYKQLKNNT